MMELLNLVRRIITAQLLRLFSQAKPERSVSTWERVQRLVSVPQPNSKDTTAESLLRCVASTEAMIPFSRQANRMCPHFH